MSDQRINSLDRRPEGVTDKTVEAVGKVSEALEWVERARGNLYDFHQNIGHADSLFSNAVDLLRESGNEEQAHNLESEICGLNVLEGRWTFQVVEEFDDGYYCKVKAQEEEIRNALNNGVRHVFEAELKEAKRTKDKAGHEATPPTA